MNQNAKRPTRLVDSIRKHISSGSLYEKECSHRDFIQDLTPRTEGCEKCLEIGDTWVHLRMCMTCGHVGCCSESKNNHAAKHFHATNHPIMRSIEPGENWLWCFVDETQLSPP
ncbi:MAG: hypothetical protein GTO41_20710 [Burkholderiales bacterium]|nr:hypothetical protein [Burkholderiales bacterium]